MSKVSMVKVIGPLAPYAPGFGRELRRRGYTDLSAAQQLRLMADVSRWLAREGLEAAALSSEQMEAFFVNRRAEGYSGLRTVRASAPMRAFLEAQGVLSTPQVPQPTSAQERLLERYGSYLVNERGLTQRVVSNYVQAATLFLGDHPGLADASYGLDAAEVSAFCIRELPKRAGSSASNLASALRAFLRFAHVEGLTRAPLAQAVPPVANRKGSGLPRGVAPATLNRLLASCDRRSSMGRRDYAILLVLVRLGLRAGEVARLELDDFDWRSGDVLVHGKGGRDQRLPLPADVGAAIAGYVHRGRPRTDSRTVFLRVIAPTVALSSPGVTWVVYSACDRVGVPRVGAHRLRHSAATQMLRAGASLIEVGQVLRHATVATTAIYAKVDFVTLRPLAPTWPGSAT